jgi:cytochrome P450
MTVVTQDSSFFYDPFSQDARREPYKFYPTLREQYPAYSLPQYDAYVFSRYSDVWDGFMDAENFSETEGQLFTRDQLQVHHRNDPPPQKLDPVTMFNFLDPPVHSNFRRVMGPSFLKGNVAKLEPAITALVRSRLRDLLPQGEFDLNCDFGSHVSVRATALIMGLPVNDAVQIVDLVNTMVARQPERPGPTESGAAAREQLMAFLRDSVAQRRKGEGPESRLIDSLIAADIVGRPLSDSEIAIDLLAILVGGTETVPKVIAGGLLELSRLPDQLTAMRADLTATSVLAFDEMLRFNAPAQWFGRTAKNRVRLGGVELEPGQRAILLIAAANRDSREFEQPEDFIWNRKAHRLLSFGVGPHFCIGNHLARLEGQIMLRELLGAIDAFSVHPDKGKRSVSEFQVGWTSLPIRFAPAR